MGPRVYTTGRASKRQVRHCPVLMGTATISKLFFNKHRTCHHSTETKGISEKVMPRCAPRVHGSHPTCPQSKYGKDQLVCLPPSASKPGDVCDIKCRRREGRRRRWRDRSSDIGSHKQVPVQSLSVCGALLSGVRHTAACCLPYKFLGWRKRGEGEGEGMGGGFGDKSTCMNLYLSCSASARSHLLRHLSRLPPLPAV